ncbi:hypothetical protein HAX54_036833 [Datura stramonium]|uniref:Uncharacterized protein n=1 Tax=Datura stramonium TaxID=4076 RepID=A0ABS8RMU9_DATST|nr:hypothetical protein [Datura stramonium]
MKDLARVTAIRRDFSVVCDGFNASTVIVQVLTNVAGDATLNGEVSVGGSGGAGAGAGEGSSPFVASGFGGVGGCSGVGGSSPIGENVPRPQETPCTMHGVCHEKIFSYWCRPSSKISEPYTPFLVKRRKKQISKALAIAKEKAKNTLSVMAGGQMERQQVDVYKRTDPKKMLDIKKNDKEKNRNQGVLHKALV